MTNEQIEEAARKYQNESIPNNPIKGEFDKALREFERIGFIHGAKWAREEAAKELEREARKQGEQGSKHEELILRIMATRIRGGE